VTIPGQARSTYSDRNADDYRHSAHRFRFATIAYRWHPLFGRKLQVSPFRRGKELTCIYTNERPDLCRELPNWMFDESCCSGMTLGPPEISIEGLNELAGVLASFDANRKGGAQSHPSKRKESSVKKPRCRLRDVCRRWPDERYGIEARTDRNRTVDLCRRQTRERV
jgi:hypothetical protein